jgi:hypothetical protein
MEKRQKTGGRTKGTLNKTTVEMRGAFQDLLESNLIKMQEDIDSLEPKDRIKTILELSKFVIPTLKATELTTGSGNDFTPIVISFQDAPPTINIDEKSKN